MTTRIANRIYRFFLCLLFSTPFVSEAVAQNEPWGATAEELKMMPPLCTGKANNGSPENIYWKNILGEDFQHVHHYCRGLVLITRSYKKRDKKERMDTLYQAVREFDYMLMQAKPDFSLMPEIHLNRGIALNLRKDASAITEFNKAIELNPHLTQAYTTLANIYITNGNKKKALEIIISGLKSNPGIKSLQRKYVELGGKEPFPSTDNLIANKLDNELTPNETKALTQEHQHITPNDNNQGSLTPQHQIEKTTPPTAAVAIQPTESIAHSPKNSKNPYCRFCPN